MPIHFSAPLAVIVATQYEIVLFKSNYAYTAG